MQKLTVVLAIWGAIGPMIGIIVGHLLTRSWQQKQWMLDRRNEEWRELLTALSTSLRASLKIYPARPLSPEEQREIVEAQADCFRVIRDRVFTAVDVKVLNLENRWSDAVQHHQQTLDAPKLGKAYDRRLYSQVTPRFVLGADPFFRFKSQRTFNEIFCKKTPH